MRAETDKPSKKKHLHFDVFQRVQNFVWSLWSRNKNSRLARKSRLSTAHLKVSIKLAVLRQKPEKSGEKISITPSFKLDNRSKNAKSLKEKRTR